jgi:predicted O-methyltransferase YrrM
MVSYFFEGYIGPTIQKYRCRHIVEIGVDSGTTTVKLLELAKELDSHLICIDPLSSFRPADDYKKLAFVAKPSLVALKAVKEINCAVIDGDHNWYTVYNELKLVDKRLTPGGVVFLHDVLWPYARRDMYYEPRRIPRRFRHPYKRMGIARGVIRLVPEGMNGQYCNAIYEGGSRNGILTAVEDFLRLTEDYAFTVVEEEFGLGILQRKS